MKILSPWIWKMAWRDSRASRRRLLLFVSSITLGVAALVAITSFGYNLRERVDHQAKELLGADLEVSSRDEFSDELVEAFDDISTRRSHQISTSTMAFFPKNGGTRLVQLRALEGEFPYYGELVTDPPQAGQRFKQGRYALVDDGLMVQMDAQVGETVRLGNLQFTILGRLIEIPGEAPVAAMVGPRVYIPYNLMSETGLITLGSRARWRAFFKLDPQQDPLAIEEDLRQRFRHERLGIDTVQERKRELGAAIENLYSFLNLVGFVALLLGGIGVASSIHLYLKQKISTVAVLRCLGAVSRQTFTVYLLQAAGLGLISALLGGLLGLGVQMMLPYMLTDFLPVDIEFSISPAALIWGVLLGLGVTLLFALLPLLPVRRITPLLTLRADYESSGTGRDPLRWLLSGIIAVAVFAFAWAQLRDAAEAAWFVAGLAAVFALLAAVAYAIMFVTRRWFPRSAGYVLRQGLANLYRPHNQTLVLMLALGLGTFLIMTLFLVQESLLGQVSGLSGEDRPNLVFFDIQNDQLEGVREKVLQQGIQIDNEVPMVTMRVAAVKGRPVREILDEMAERRQEETREGRENREEGLGPDGPARRRWPFVREYRSTYRDHLNDAETLVEGRFTGRVEPGTSPVPISMDQRIADMMRLEIGDRITFDVQGLPLECVLGSTRDIEWERFQPAFFVVFPRGVLEEAPQFHVLVARAESTEASGQAQRAVVADFPNVSAIDLSLILSTVDEILDKVAFVIRFMALFSVITGLIVLAGAVITGRFQRIRESVLLRTLGASRRQVRRILLIEYLSLGIMAALTGLILAVAAAWALAVFAFETDYAPSPLPLALAFLLVGFLTVTIGMLNSRGILDRPPLEVLRTEEVH
ncbi:MAG TPA: FtsX-like permease family protein [Acidobacteriota bacterium]|nr:FtsX-like permease family protein [Acidobacteriota bacterium]